MGLSRHGDSGALDPVDLIRGPSRGAGTFRCRSCGLKQSFEEILPTGGFVCRRCGANVNVAQRVQYAAAKPRVVAAVVDIASLMLPFLVLAAVIVAFDPLVPKDRRGHVTPHAMLVLRLIGVAYFGAYFWITEAIGATLGKRFVGIHVVRAANWHRPGLAVGLLRLVAKTLTVASLGIGFIIMVLDPEGRALHDRIAGTRVIEQ